MILEIEKRWALVLTLTMLLSCGVLIFREVKGQQVWKKLTVVSYNVGTLHGEKPALQPMIDAIKKEGVPDLVVLQEVPDEAFVLHIAQSLGSSCHVFSVYSANGSGNGLAVISDRPLINPEMHLLEPYGHAILAVELLINEKRLTICSVHLERVHSMKKNKDGFEMPWEEAFRILKTELTSNTPRSMAVEEILTFLALRPSEEVIIGGDFNTVPFSTAIRRMGKRYSDALWLTSDYFTGTYTRVKFPVKPRIDYIFHSAGIEVLAASVIQEGAGDHYPVRAVFSF